MWADVGKIALISFLLVGVGVLAVRVIRRGRAVGLLDNPPPGAEAWWKAEFGPRPKLTPPAWVHWDEEEDPDAEDP